MKCISWNVNGIRAAMNKGFESAFYALDADIFCLQETKVQPGQIDFAPEGYRAYWHYAEKKGYSGTAIFTRREPESVLYGLDDLDHEGRLITLDMGSYRFCTVYTPNAQDGLRRLSFRMEWENAFREYLKALAREKPVIVCGDMNVAHREIDLKNPDTNHGNPGFSDEERGKMTELLSSGFVDTFRLLYPDLSDAYTWWSYRARARERNVGWRIDYFLVSESLRDRVVSAAIHSDIQGSDHCPVELSIQL